MKKYLLFVLIAVIALAIGCGKPYFIGVPIDKAKVDQIQAGNTPEARITEMFGQPASKDMVAGETRYTYSYYQSHPNFWSKDVVYKSTLQVFAKNGVVQRYNFIREGVDYARAAQ